MTSTTAASSRNVPLIAARVVAGLLGGIQLAGAVFFLFIAPEGASWVGVWLDVPLVALLLSGIFLKLGLAVLPGLQAARRIAMGFLAITIGVVVTLLKVTMYDEPEAVLFLAVEAVLLLLLVLARRAGR